MAQSFPSPGASGTGSSPHLSHAHHALKSFAFQAPTLSAHPLLLERRFRRARPSERPAQIMARSGKRLLHAADHEAARHQQPVGLVFVGGSEAPRLMLAGPDPARRIRTLAPHTGPRGSPRESAGAWHVILRSRPP